MAVPATPALRKAVATLRTIAQRVRSVPAENLHLTLRFLGEVNEAVVPDIVEAMRHSVAALPPHTVLCRGVGCFHRGRRGSVVWAGLEGTQRLAATILALNRHLSAAGLAPGPKAWAPHVTLARCRGVEAEALSTFLESWSEQSFGPVPVEDVRLVRSKLHAAGALHEVVERVVLAGKRTDRGG